MRRVFIVLVEAGGIQPFVFDTDKRRENVGASQLVHEFGTTWVDDAIAELQLVTGPIETAMVEKVVATAGRLTLLVDDGDLGRRFVTALTMRALREAPGLDVCGVVTGSFEWEDPGGPGNPPVHQAIQHANALLPEVRARRPGPELRFMRLPPVDECRSSGLPAKSVDHRGDPKSAPSLARLAAAGRALDRLAGALGQDRDELEAVLDHLAQPDEVDGVLDRSAREAVWVGVVHADGNGVGRLFRDFGAHAATVKSGIAPNRGYVDALRAFSQALDACAERALVSALAVVPPTELDRRDRAGKAPTTVVVPTVLPLVVGGDDLTVLCDGASALRFAQSFLRAFEHQTESEPAVARIAQAATGSARLGASAGVAIVKPHFPFAAAYVLAEDLLRRAKVVKRLVSTPCSALDFHVHHDPSGGDLGQIESRLRPVAERQQGSPRGETSPKGTKLWGGPYIVTGSDRLPDGEAWCERHLWEGLERRVAALGARDPGTGRLRLPGSHTHDLRQALFLGRLAADRRLRYITPRYGDGLAALMAGDGTLFWREEDGWVTGLLDAMDASAFLRAPVAP
ncbi:MAG: hypothetical protein QOE93_2122 [Actinomycetota bacterium]|jgi:hypothetical protein|nr:hypothetical protein [Actinomycetota bacterium]